MAQRKYDQALKDQAIEAVVKHGRSVVQTVVIWKIVTYMQQSTSNASGYNKLIAY